MNLCKLFYWYKCGGNNQVDQWKLLSSNNIFQLMMYWGYLHGKFGYAQILLFYKFKSMVDINISGLIQLVYLYWPNHK